MSLILDLVENRWAVEGQVAHNECPQKRKCSLRRCRADSFGRPEFLGPSCWNLHPEGRLAREEMAPDFNGALVAVDDSQHSGVCDRHDRHSRDNDLPETAPAYGTTELRWISRERSGAFGQPTAGEKSKRVNSCSRNNVRCTHASTAAACRRSGTTVSVSFRAAEAFSFECGGWRAGIRQHRGGRVLLLRRPEPPEFWHFARDPALLPVEQGERSCGFRTCHPSGVLPTSRALCRRPLHELANSSEIWESGLRERKCSHSPSGWWTDTKMQHG